MEQRNAELLNGSSSSADASSSASASSSSSSSPEVAAAAAAVAEPPSPAESTVKREVHFLDDEEGGEELENINMSYDDSEADEEPDGSGHQRLHPSQAALSSR